MDKAMEYIVKNKGKMKDSSTYFFKCMEEFPTYDLLSQAHTKNHPHLQQQFENLKKAK